MKLNRHCIAGRIVDVEFGALPSGAATIRLRVQTDDGWYDTKKSEYQKRNTYHTVKQIGKKVEKLRGLQENDWVYVEGSRLTDSWESGGEKKYADFLKAITIHEIANPFEESESSEASAPPQSKKDDGIPF
jgi:single-stranded DNA-binding protein